MVSSFGRVRNWRSGVTLRPRPSGWGYLQVVLYRKKRTYTLSVHRLVAEAFYDGWYDTLEVNHIDGDKWNNHVWNLEWVTKSENNRHAIMTGLRKPRQTRVVIMETGEEFDTVKDCADYIKGHGAGISAVLNDRAPHYKGYTFRYG